MENRLTSILLSSGLLPMPTISTDRGRRDAVTSASMVSCVGDQGREVGWSICGVQPCATFSSRETGEAHPSPLVVALLNHLHVVDGSVCEDEQHMVLEVRRGLPDNVDSGLHQRGKQGGAGKLPRRQGLPANKRSGISRAAWDELIYLIEREGVDSSSTPRASLL